VKAKTWPPSDQLVAELAERFAGLKRRNNDGGKPTVRDPGHPLARKDGWVVAARWLVHERWAAQEEPLPRCEAEGCGLRVGWSKRRTQRVRSIAAVVPWPVDGDPSNLHPGNWMGVCAACSRRGNTLGRIVRGERGRFATTLTLPQDRDEEGRWLAR